MSIDDTDQKPKALQENGEVVVLFDDAEEHKDEANRFRRALKYSQSFYKSRSDAARRQGREEVG